MKLKNLKKKKVYCSPLSLRSRVYRGRSNLVLRLPRRPSTDSTGSLQASSGLLAMTMVASFLKFAPQQVATKRDFLHPIFRGCTQSSPHQTIGRSKKLIRMRVESATSRRLFTGFPVKVSGQNCSSNQVCTGFNAFPRLNRLAESIHQPQQ